MNSALLEQIEHSVSSGRPRCPAQYSISSHIIVIVAALGYVAYADALQYVVVKDIHQMIP